MAPRARLAGLAAAALLIAAVCAPPGRADEDAPAAPKKPCHEVEKQVQYRGLAYQHTVVIRNTCDKKIACTIKASSNPDPIELKVAAKASESVVVNNGSPASEFSADVDCK
jgi:hypothetical protein